MSCRFDLVHFRHLLEAAKSSGYRFVGFDHEPRPGDLYLRHDVDLALEAALETARLEHEAGVRATYFVMTESVFYNLASPAGERTLRELRELGHAVGLHAVHPRLELDERFDPVVAWHNPAPAYMGKPLDGAVNVMQEPYFDPDHYRSDSNQRWRHGCPHDALARGEFEWLQLLTHPEIWAYEGETMGQTMRSMLDAKRELALRQLAEDRIDLD